MFKWNLPTLLSCDLPHKRFDEILDKLRAVYPEGEDPWGLNLEQARKSIEYVYPLYSHYFKVRLFGAENVKDEPYIITSNHSGQIAIDGMLITMAFVWEIDPPRILRSMVERFFTSLPWVATLAQQGGAVLGDRQNCLNLLERKQSVLVFPEGVRGVAKSTNEFYQLQYFTRGFYRMALTSQTKILPVAVVGAEEVFPWVYQARGMAKTLGLPALPLSPLYFPLPSPIDIYLGQPMELGDISPEAPDNEIDYYVDKVKDEVQYLIELGLKKRRPFFASKKTGRNHDS